MGKRRLGWAIVVVGVLALGCVLETRAEYTYRFNSTTSAPNAGPVSGYFTVPDSAILDGYISVSDISALSFALPSATAPFTPATFALPAPIFIFSPFNGNIRVDPVTGQLDGFGIEIDNLITSQQLFISFSTQSVTSQYNVVPPSGPANIVAGRGVWQLEYKAPPPPSIASVPALDSRGLLALALALVGSAVPVLARRTKSDT